MPISFIHRLDELYIFLWGVCYFDYGAGTCMADFWRRRRGCTIGPKNLSPVSKITKAT